MRASAVLSLLVLAGCQQEPSFDERYSAASKAVAASGAALESELKAREAWRAAEDATTAPPTGAPVTPRPSVRPSSAAE